MANRIDTHHHVVPPFYRRWLADKGLDAGGLPVPEWSAEDDLRLMDERGIATALLSVSTPGVEPGDQAEARDMARRLNTYVADLRAGHPGRFGLFATLTLPDIDGAVEEARFAYDELSADGVVLHAHTGQTYLGDRSLDPLMAELDARNAVVFVHPGELPGGSVDGIPAYVGDFLLDTVRAAVNLGRTGVVRDFPRVRWIFSHGGGFIPYAAPRLAGFASPDGDIGDGWANLRSFYYDTALASTTASLPSLLSFADPQRVLFGCDFPYATREVTGLFAAGLDGFDPADHYAINRANAERLFPRLRATRDA